MKQNAIWKNASEMVKEVNETLLSTEDILSDHAYFYNAYLGDITIKKNCVGHMPHTKGENEIFI